MSCSKQLNTICRADIVVDESFGGFSDEGWSVLKEIPLGQPSVILENPMDPQRFKDCKRMLDAPNGALYWSVCLPLK